MSQRKRPVTEYCTLDVAYPTEGYIAILFAVLNDSKSIIPVDQIFASLDESSEYLGELVDEFMRRDILTGVEDTCLLIPIRLDSFYSLKREYWENPSIPYTYDHKTNLFLQLAKKPELHKLLVTPDFYDEEQDEWSLSIALPLKYKTEGKALEQFMLTSDSLVDERAKNAAIYTLGGAMHFNWKTKAAEKIHLHRSEIDDVN